MRHILSTADIPPSTPLFRGIPAADLDRALTEMRTRFIGFDAGDQVREADAERLCASFLVDGCADGYVYDEGGNRSILHLFSAGQVLSYGREFGATSLPRFDIVARTDCRVVTFTTDYLPQSSDWSRHLSAVMRANLAASLADLDADLMATLDIRLRRTIRGKVLAYLEHEMIRQGTTHVQIAFNRQELADYLCVDRAALSRELGNLRDEGHFEFEHNRFDLHLKPRRPHGPAV